MSNTTPLIEQKMYGTVFNDLIEPFLSQYISQIFEEVCIQFLERINGKEILPFTFYDIGRWWGSNRIKRREEEIDILAYDNKGNAMIGECKWRSEPADMEVLNTLIEKSSIFNIPE